MKNLASKAGVSLALVATAIVLGATAAFADPPYDPTSGAFASGVTQDQSFVTGVAAVGIIGLAVAATAVMLAVRWIKKVRGVGA
jgi:hypothetical protein